MIIEEQKIKDINTIRTDLKELFRDFFGQFTCRDDVWAKMVDYGDGRSELIDQVCEYLSKGEEK